MTSGIGTTRLGTGNWEPGTVRYLGRIVLVALVGLLAVAPVAPAQTIAITGGKLYPVSGPPIENGTVLVRDGKLDRDYVHDVPVIWWCEALGI